MPFNPGVTDIRGQLLAQGRVAGAQALSGGIADFGQGVAQGQQAYQQNKLLAADAIAKFEAAMQQDQQMRQQNPNIPGESKRGVEGLRETQKGRHAELPGRRGAGAIFRHLLEAERNRIHQSTARAAGE